MSRFVDLTRRQFGRLIVIRRTESDKWGCSRWVCQCSCDNGYETIVLGKSLKNGTTKSCGCLRKDIDNDKGYCKSNCRWSTIREQARNRRTNHLETYNGKTQCLKEWAEEYVINYHTLCSRIYIYKWSIEKALTTPVKKRRKN